MMKKYFYFLCITILTHQKSTLSHATMRISISHRKRGFRRMSEKSQPKPLSAAPSLKRYSFRTGFAASDRAPSTAASLYRISLSLHRYPSLAAMPFLAAMPSPKHRLQARLCPSRRECFRRIVSSDQSVFIRKARYRKSRSAHFLNANRLPR